MYMLKYGILITIISVLVMGCRNKSETVDNQIKTEDSNELIEEFPASKHSNVFHKELTFQNISFDINTLWMDTIQTLTIQIEGLEKNDQNIDLEIDGMVVNAEIEDLNSDGYPEILIYTVSSGSENYGNVIGYSVTNEKSISPIYFPEISQNPRINKGYMGHDNFAIVEANLNRSFQLFTKGDSALPTGYIRQIRYVLVDGEDSKKFVTSMVLEYPKN